MPSVIFRQDYENIPPRADGTHMQPFEHGIEFDESLLDRDYPFYVMCEPVAVAVHHETKTITRTYMDIFTGESWFFRSEYLENGEIRRTVSDRF